MQSITIRSCMVAVEQAHRLDVAMYHAETVHMLEPENKLLDPVIPESRIDRLIDVRREGAVIAELHKNPKEDT